MFAFQVHDKLCTCHLKNGDPSKSIEACSKALKISEEPRLYCDRADAYIADEMYSEGKEQKNIKDKAIEEICEKST